MSVGRRGGGLFLRSGKISPSLRFGWSQEHATFKVIVLRSQEELDEPSQHCTIRIIMSHDSPDDLQHFGWTLNRPWWHRRFQPRSVPELLKLLGFRDDLANCSELLGTDTSPDRQNRPECKTPNFGRFYSAACRDSPGIIPL